MKRYMMSILMFAALCMTSYAQDNKKQCPEGKKCKMECKEGNRPSPQQMIEMRVSKMAAELMLSDDAKTKFIPLYKEYMEAMHKSMCGDRKEDAKPQEKKELTDAEIDNMMASQFKKSAELCKIKESYYGKFRKILSAKQTLKVFKQDKMPKPKHFKEMKKRRPAGAKPCQGKKMLQRHPITGGPEDVNK